MSAAGGGESSPHVPPLVPPLASPLVSVILPTFNCQATLGAALRSLAEQQSRDFEVVLSDGASQDGTMQVARNWAPALPACQLLSRPDHGVYDAVNLGIAAARGHWVLVLGGDDRLHAPGTLLHISAILRESTAAVVYGDVRVMNDNRMGVPVNGRHAGPMPLSKLLRANICQQAIFYRRTLFEELGPFELAYPVMADWDFNLRVAFHAPMQWVDQVIVDYAATGLSAQREDRAAMRGIPERVRREFMRRSADRNLWPHQRILLRQADTLRRHGEWVGAMRQLGSYVCLRALRVAARLRAP